MIRIAMTAASIVAPVNGKSRPTPSMIAVRIGGQIGGQFAEPRIWLPVGAILAAMGMIPAMPQSVFLPLSALAFALAAARAGRCFTGGS